MSAQIQVMQSDSCESEFRLAAPQMDAKLENIDELSCQLPASGAPPSADMDHSPILIHSDVLDSVFSTNLDDQYDGLTATPMFDELDFMIDGTKVNSKEDWVSLFKDEPAAPAGVAEQDEVLDDLVGDEYKAAFNFVPVRTQPKQLETPVTPSLATPVMRDAAPLEPRGSKRSVDHLGCVSYSKKQRAQPLKPVAVDNEDPVAMKRARNTEAARRSRARKMERMSQLEAKVEDLIDSKKELQDEVDRLRAILVANNISF